MDHYFTLERLVHAYFGDESEEGVLQLNEHLQWIHLPVFPSAEARHYALL